MPIDAQLLEIQGCSDFRTDLRTREVWLNILNNNVAEGILIHPGRKTWIDWVAAPAAGKCIIW